MKDQFISARRVVDFPWYGGGWDLVTGKKTGDNKYSVSPWAFSCMNIRGSELANIPWRLTRNGKVVESHPIIDMLTNFGTESNYAEGVSATEIDLLLTGNAFWLRDFDMLKRLNPNTVEVKATRAGISSFVQTIDGQVVNTFDRDEIIYFREFNPDSDLLAGIPVMTIIKNAIGQEKEAGEYVEAFFKNDATPSLLLTTEQTISEPEMNRTLRWWKSKFGGVKKSHQPAIAGKGLKAQILSRSVKDNALIEIREQARDDICTGMRVPKVLLSMADATYANAAEARKFMIEDLILPRSKYYEDVINQDLIQKIDSSLLFEFDPGQLPILQESSTAKWDRLNEAEQSGVISKEFTRQQMGWPETSAPEMTSEQETLRAWRRKSLKAVKKGEPADVDFKTDEIALTRQAAIRAQLSKATTVSDVGKVFND